MDSNRSDRNVKKAIGHVELRQQPFPQQKHADIIPAKLRQQPLPQQKHADSHQPSNLRILCWLVRKLSTARSTTGHISSNKPYKITSRAIIQSDLFQRHELERIIPTTISASGNCQQQKAEQNHADSNKPSRCVPQAISQADVCLKKQAKQMYAKSNEVGRNVSPSISP